jgi:hypothetical protein
VLIKSGGQVIMFFKLKGRKGAQGSSGGKRVILIYGICKLMINNLFLINIITILVYVKVELSK